MIGDMQKESPVEESPYLVFHIKCIRKLGVWPDRGFIGRLSLFTCCSVILFALIYLPIVNQVRIAYNDIGIVSECLTFSSIYIMTFVKLLTFVFREDDFKYLIHLVKNSFFSYEQRNKKKCENILKKAETKSKTLTYTIFGLSFATVLFLRLVTAFSVGRPKYDAMNVTIPRVRRLPIRIVIPGVDQSNNYIFWILYCYQVSIGMLQVVLMPACDGFFLSLMTHVHGQFVILRENLENVHKLGSESELRLGSSIKSDVDLMLHTDKFWPHSTVNKRAIDQQVKRRLGNCIRHHQEILKFMSILEKVLNPIMLLQFISDCIILCTAAFNVTMALTDRMKLFGMILFVGTTLLKLGMYCYYSEKIKTQCDGVGYSAYFSQWPNLSPDAKRSIRIIMIRSQKAALLSVGKFADLSLETLTAMLRLSYTYFALLNEFRD